MSSETDFDFLIGRWNVTHHTLKERLSGCTEWLVAQATDEVKKVLLGQANIDHYQREFKGRPYEGMSIRIFNSFTKQWSIYWADTLGLRVDPPVIGHFQDGVGTFIGDDIWNEIPIKVRFIWSDIRPDSARWEQAFSTDGGETWEVNSIMEFTRIQN